MPPLVSVVLPVRNGGDYLREAVSSILQQTISDLELLLVDDHSADGAVAALGLSDSRLHILHSPGAGVSAAFNAGMARSKGAFIARMDADDVAEPIRLERQLAMFETDSSLGIVGACVDFFGSGDIGQGNRLYRDWLNSLRTPQDIRRSMFIESPIPNPSTLFRRETLQRLGGYQDPQWPEDYDLFLRADAAGVRMAKPDEILLHWRDHPGRLTRTDPRYSLENFQRAKAHYLARGRLPDKALLIWGAGPTGKLTHDLLREQEIEVSGFIEVHPRRIGGRKRGKPVWGLDASLRKGTFVLVAVGARDARGEIRDYLQRHRREEGRDFLFVA